MAKAFLAVLPAVAAYDNLLVDNIMSAFPQNNKVSSPLNHKIFKTVLNIRFGITIALKILEFVVRHFSRLARSALEARYAVPPGVVESFDRVPDSVRRHLVRERGAHWKVAEHKFSIFL